MPHDKHTPRTQGTHFVAILRELGVRVETPWTLLAGEREVEVDAYLPDFGGPRGTVMTLGDMRDFDMLSELSREAGVYCSSLNADAETSEESVQETLNDWGYYGPPDRKPGWYTGAAWGTE